jgi:NADH:ubiquinone oxidoreductase subunit 5 (subunit L)/multisubunit Na+/H+ antiporter MnhA subunit
MNYLSVLTFFLFIGVVGESAQFGLHTWLPDAIEGPTPVSALLHAATIVTAGVFLFIRCSFLFEYTNSILSLSSFWGLITALFAATCALIQNDIKKIIAYSTCSQLGYMVFICGLSQYSVSLFHLFNHAFFKALLFLGAGVIIHFICDNQDIRQIGFIKIFLPAIFVIILVGTFALLGFPFLTGFYSKDLILELTFVTTFFIDSIIIFWLALLTTTLTALYSIRLLYFVFLGPITNMIKIYTPYLYYPSLLIRIPLYILFFCSVFIGFYFKELFTSFGSPFFNTSIFILPEHCVLLFADFLPFYIKIIPFLCSCIGITAFYFFNLQYLFFNKSVFIFFSFKWYVDKFYSVTSVYFLKGLYIYIYILFDKGVIELVGPTGIMRGLTSLSRKLVINSSGYFFSYICISVIGCIFIFSFLILYF